MQYWGTRYFPVMYWAGATAFWANLAATIQIWIEKYTFYSPIVKVLALLSTIVTTSLRQSTITKSATYESRMKLESV